MGGPISLYLRTVKAYHNGHQEQSEGKAKVFSYNPFILNGLVIPEAKIPRPKKVLTRTLAFRGGQLYVTGRRNLKTEIRGKIWATKDRGESVSLAILILLLVCVLLVAVFWSDPAFIVLLTGFIVALVASQLISRELSREFSPIEKLFSVWNSLKIHRKLTPPTA